MKLFIRLAAAAALFLPVIPAAGQDKPRTESVDKRPVPSPQISARPVEKSDPDRPAIVLKSTDPDVPKRRIMKEFVGTDIRVIYIAPDKYDDLSGCDAVSGQALLDTLKNCRPVQQPFVLFAEIKDDLDQLDHQMPAAQMDKLLDKMKSTGLEMIDLSQDRTWPAQDITLILGHFLVGEVAGRRDDYPGALEHFDRIIAIMEDERIKEPDFNEADQIRRRKARMEREMRRADEGPDDGKWPDIEIEEHDQ